MAFCVQCGTRVGDADRFCVKCGAPQKVTAGAKAGSQSSAPRPVSDPFSGISGRTASLLCYVPWVGWIAAIVVLASHRFRTDAQVRFHAFQGLYIFVAWLMVEWVVSPFMYASDFLIGLPFPSPGRAPAATGDLHRVDLHDDQGQSRRELQAADYWGSGGAVGERAAVLIPRKARSLSMGRIVRSD